MYSLSLSPFPIPAAREEPGLSPGRVSLPSSRPYPPMPQGLGDPIGQGLSSQPGSFFLLFCSVLVVGWGEGGHLPYLFGVAFREMSFSRILCNCCIWSCELTALYMRINLFLSTNSPSWAVCRLCVYGWEKTELGERHMSIATLWLLEPPPLLPSPSSGGLIDILGHPWVNDKLWGLRSRQQIRRPGHGAARGRVGWQRLWTKKGEPGA